MDDEQTGFIRAALTRVIYSTLLMGEEEQEAGMTTYSRQETWLPWRQTGTIASRADRSGRRRRAAVPLG